MNSLMSIDTSQDFASLLLIECRYECLGIDRSMNFRSIMVILQVVGGLQ